MTSKTTKFRIKPTRHDISPPSNFKHVAHAELKTNDSRPEHPSSHPSPGKPVVEVVHDTRHPILLEINLEPSISASGKIYDYESVYANIYSVDRNDCVQLTQGQTSDAVKPRAKSKVTTAEQCTTTDDSYTINGNSESEWIRAGNRKSEATVRSFSGSSQTNLKKTLSSKSRCGQAQSAKSMPISTQMCTTPASPFALRRGGFRQPPASDRECFADALRSNVTEIVGQVIFKESELPDELTVDGCITEDESFEIQEIRNRKDQVRVLLSKIVGRDLDILEKFVKRIEKIDKNLADKIYSHYENNRRTLVKKPACACCEMKMYVDIKIVADNMWSIGAIDHGLYGEIARVDKPGGAQNDLWIRLIESINNIKDKEQRRKASVKLMRSLEANGHYRYIAKALEASIPKNNSHSLTCRCTIDLPIFDSYRGSTSCDPRSSTRSSNSDSHYSCSVPSETETIEAAETEVSADDVDNAQELLTVYQNVNLAEESPKQEQQKPVPLPRKQSLQRKANEQQKHTEKVTECQYTHQAGPLGNDKMDYSSSRNIFEIYQDGSTSEETIQQRQRRPKPKPRKLTKNQ